MRRDTHFHNLLVLNEQVTNLTAENVTANVVVAENVTANVVIAENLQTGDANLCGNVNVCGNLSVDGSLLQLTRVVDANSSPCVTMNFIADEPIAANRMLKVGANAFTVAEIKINVSGTPVIGISTNAASAGEIVKVCVGGVFKVQITGSVSVGDPIRKSESSNGYASAIDDDATQIFGVALQNGVDGDVISAIFAKSDAF